MDIQKGGQALQESLKICGFDILKNSKQFNSVIDDLLGGIDYRAEKIVLKHAAESYVLRSLFESAEITADAAERAVVQFRRESRMTQEDAEFTVQCVIVARGGNPDIVTRTISRREEEEKRKRQEEEQKRREEEWRRREEEQKRREEEWRRKEEEWRRREEEQKRQEEERKRREAERREAERRIKEAERREEEQKRQEEERRRREEEQKRREEEQRHQEEEQKRQEKRWSDRMFFKEFGIVTTNIVLTFEEAALGCEKEIEFKLEYICKICNGSGAKPNTLLETCKRCSGSGSIERQSMSPFGLVTTKRMCPDCNGRAKKIKEKCSNCQGSGYIEQNKKLVITVPAGIEKGQVIPIQDKGDLGLNGGKLLVDVDISNDNAPSDTNFIVRACNKVSIDSVDCEVGNPISPSSKKYKKAKNNFKIPDNEKIYFIYDATLLGSCKKGFAICTNGIYEYIKKNGYISWEEFKSLEVRMQDEHGGIMIGDEYFLAGKIAAVSIVSLLKSIQEEYSKRT